jgi:hypothetical protein
MKDTFVISGIRPPEPVGWLESKLPKNVMKILDRYIEVAKKNPESFNEKLAGNISKSLILKDEDNCFFKDVLVLFINQFRVNYPNYLSNIAYLSENAPYCLGSLWVNFQKQHEFNPSHDHSGVFSFVIWVKIPTDWREQHALPFSANSNLATASDFEFQYTSMMGDMKTFVYTLDKESEGVMLFFPSKLRHTVYPFYNCDEERISISGNIWFDLSRKCHETI